MSDSNLARLRAVVNPKRLDVLPFMRALTGDQSAVPSHLAPAVAAFVDLFAPDVEIDVSALEVPGLEVFHGLNGLREMSARWFEEWEQYSWTVDNWDEVGEHVLLDSNIRATGRSSGAEVVWTTSHVWTFRDGKVIRWRQFRDRAAALIAVGR